MDQFGTGHLMKKFIRDELPLAQRKQQAKLNLLSISLIATNKMFDIYVAIQYHRQNRQSRRSAGDMQPVPFSPHRVDDTALSTACCLSSRKEEATGGTRCSWWSSSSSSSSRRRKKVRRAGIDIPNERTRNEP